MDNQQAKIDIYLNQPEIRMALNMLSLKYDFVVDELAKSVLQEEISIDEVVEFLVAEFSFEAQTADELVDNLLLYVVEPFYVPVSEDELREEMEIEEDFEDDTDEPLPREKKQINWRNFIKPKVLQAGMEELNKAASNDVAQIRNYLWKYLGLNKPEEVIVVLNWLAMTGELVKLWQEDNRFKGILKKYITIKYSEEVADNMMSSGISPALFALALQMILKDKLGLSELDSAMIAMSIIDHMLDEDKPKYILTAYVDAKDDSFNWNQIQESAQGLVLAI